jgi:pyrroline-5-carboxylate reductase
MTKNIVLIGAGHMGSAMLNGWLSVKQKLGSITVIDPKYIALPQKYGDAGRFIGAPDDVVASADILVFAIKPQNFADILPDYRAAVKNGASILSVAAGITTDAIADWLQCPKNRIFRAMPNLPAARGMGITALYTPNGADSTMNDLIQQLLRPLGGIVAVRGESEMHAVTALSGSGPAYIFALCESMAAAGIAAGLDPDLAARLARQTVIGSAAMLDDNADSPTEWRLRVTSPAGTTAAAMDILMADNAFADLLERAIASAVERSKKMAKG